MTAAQQLQPPQLSPRLQPDPALRLQSWCSSALSDDHHQRQLPSSLGQQPQPELLELVLSELSTLQSAVRDKSAADQQALSRLDALSAEVSTPFEHNN